MEIDNGKIPGRRTIFHEVLSTRYLEGKGVTDRETRESVTNEVQVIVSAASDTTGNALSTSTFGIISNPHVHKAVVDELNNAFPDPKAVIKTTDVEKLEYISAVIKEGLRMSHGVVSRLPRVTPKEGATFNGFHIPGGVSRSSLTASLRCFDTSNNIEFPQMTVSMDNWTMHRSLKAFPDPDRFDPSRWLDPDTEAVRLRERYLTAFSKGSRMCIGQDLAKCQLHLGLATVFRRFPNLQLWEFGAKEIQWVDAFAPQRPKSSPPYRVV
jgi:cytochrome P450